MKVEDGRLARPDTAELNPVVVSVMLAVALIMGACTQGPGDLPSGNPSPFQVGVVAEAPVVGQCLAGDECHGFTVTCPYVQVAAKGTLDIRRPLGNPRGVIVLFSGGGGNQFWQFGAQSDVQFSASSGSPGRSPQEAARLAADFLAGLRSDGFVTVMVRWQRGWLASASSEAVGPARLACRPASVIRWIRSRVYDPLGLVPDGSSCGFCLTGNSAGSSAIAYSLAFYGTASLVDAAVLTGGPPHTALARGCLRDPGYAYLGRAPNVIDASYGFTNGNGPCAKADPAWRKVWERDSVELGGTDYDYASTRILLLLGADDSSGVADHQLTYAARLRSAGSPQVEQVTVPGMTHAITASEDGLGLMKDWFLAS